MKTSPHRRLYAVVLILQDRHHDPNSQKIGDIWKSMLWSTTNAKSTRAKPGTKDCNEQYLIKYNLFKTAWAEEIWSVLYNYR